MEDENSIGEIDMEDFFGNKAMTETRLLSGDKALFNPPRVYILLEAVKKIEYFVQREKGECNGVGLVKRFNGNDFIIVDIFTIKQSANGSMAEFDDDAYNDFVYDLIQAGGKASELNFQWHSEGEMLVGPSSIDLETISQSMADFRISLILDRSRNYHCRIDILKPFYLAIEVSLLVIAPNLLKIKIEKELIARCEKEADMNIKSRSYFNRFCGDLVSERADASQKPFVIPYEYLVFEEERDEFPEAT